MIVCNITKLNHVDAGKEWVALWWNNLKCQLEVRGLVPCPTLCFQTIEWRGDQLQAATLVLHPRVFPMVILPVTNEITFWSEPGRSPTAPTAPGRRGEGGVLVLVVPKCCKTWGGFLETGQKPFKFSALAADCFGRVFFWSEERGIIDRLGPITLLVSFFRRPRRPTMREYFSVNRDF